MEITDSSFPRASIMVISSIYRQAEFTARVRALNTHMGIHILLCNLRAFLYLYKCVKFVTNYENIDNFLVIFQMFSSIICPSLSFCLFCCCFFLFQIYFQIILRIFVLLYISFREKDDNQA